jgi:hypothetical protein
MKTIGIAAVSALTLVLASSTAYAGRDSNDWTQYQRAIAAKQQAMSQAGAEGRAGPVSKEGMPGGFDGAALIKRVHPRNAYGY